MAEEDAERYDDDEEDEEEENDLELDLDGDDGSPGLSLDVDDAGDEEAQRRRYGLNSPKGDADNVTPATKFRTEAGINSPKNAEKKMDFDGDSDGDGDAGAVPDALAGLVTQVDRGSDNPITQVSADDDASGFGGGGGGGGSSGGGATQADSGQKSTVETDLQPKGGGCCSCLSALFSCFTGSGSANENRSGTQQAIKSSSSKPAQPQRVNSTSNGPTQQKLLDRNEEMAPNSTEQANSGTPDSDEDESSSTEYGQALLPPLIEEDEGKKCLVLDLDETLVHSSFKPISTADFIIPVEIDNVVHRVYVMKRPYVDEFLVRMAKHYEIVIFTASLSKYADPLLDQLDTHRTIRHRLFRESCTLHSAAYVKDMRRMGRKLKNTIIVDNSPQSYLFQPKNAVPIASWFDDKSDTQLLEFADCCEGILKNIKDVRNILNASEKSFKWLCAQANEPVSKFE